MYIVLDIIFLDFMRFEILETCHVITTYLAYNGIDAWLILEMENKKERE